MTRRRRFRILNLNNSHHLPPLLTNRAAAKKIAWISSFSSSFFISSNRVAVFLARKVWHSTNIRTSIQQPHTTLGSRKIVTKWQNLSNFSQKSAKPVPAWLRSGRKEGLFLNGSKSPCLFPPSPSSLVYDKAIPQTDSDRGERRREK